MRMLNCYDKKIQSNLFYLIACFVFKCLNEKKMIFLCLRKACRQVGTAWELLQSETTLWRLRMSYRAQPLRGSPLGRGTRRTEVEVCCGRQQRWSRRCRRGGGRQQRWAWRPACQGLWNCKWCGRRAQGPFLSCVSAVQTRRAWTMQGRTFEMTAQRLACTWDFCEVEELSKELEDSFDAARLECLEGIKSDVEDLLHKCWYIFFCDVDLCHQSTLQHKLGAWLQWCCGWKMALLACDRRPLWGCRAHRRVRALCWGTILLLVDANDTTEQTAAAGLLHHSIPQHPDHRCRGPSLWVSARLWRLWLCERSVLPHLCVC